MIIRPATSSDAETLALYNIAMARETEHINLDGPTVRAGVRAVIDDPAKGLFFVAETAGKVIGQLLVTREWSDWRNGDMWWIQSVYVHPEHRRNGVFKALYRHLEEKARAAGVVALRLYVEEDNAAAQRTYERMGMHKSYYRVMEAMLRGPASRADEKTR